MGSADLIKTTKRNTARLLARAYNARASRSSWVRMRPSSRVWPIVPKGGAISGMFSPAFSSRLAQTANGARPFAFCVHHGPPSYRLYHPLPSRAKIPTRDQHTSLPSAVHLTCSAVPHYNLIMPPKQHCCEACTLSDLVARQAEKMRIMREALEPFAKAFRDPTTAAQSISLHDLRMASEAIGSK